MPDPNENKELAKAPAQKARSEKFTAAVMKEFNAVPGELNLTPFQKKLIQNYFIKLDDILKTTEIKRAAKQSGADPVPVTWEFVNMNKLALEVVALSSVGLDPLQPNHVNLIPFKNKHTGLYDVNPIIGYRGLELKATRYGVDPPKDVIVELVFSTDNFKQIKKDVNNEVEGYTFEIVNDFDRGELVGAFYYFRYEDATKNKIRTFNKSDIDKRKPKYASAEFWGGTRPKWVNGQRQGTEEVEGWYEEMAYKTVSRAAYNSITIDSEKINLHLNTLAAIEERGHNFIPLENSVKEEIKEDTVSETIEFEDLTKITPEPEPEPEENDEAPY